MKKTVLAALMVVMSLGFVSAAQADEKGRKAKYKVEDLLSSATIAEQGGVELKIEDYGVVKILDLKADGKKGQTCMLVIPAFKEAIKEVQPKKGVKVEITLQVIPLTKDDGTVEFYCEGGGEGCVATVEMVQVAETAGGRM